MIIAMRSDATEEQIEFVCASIRHYGDKPHVNRGEERVVIGAIGDGDNKDHLQSLRAVDGVENVVPILQPYKVVGRELQQQKTIVKVGDLEIGGAGVVIIAGAGSGENPPQLMGNAPAAETAGGRGLRGGGLPTPPPPPVFFGLT